jgi:peroxiredoxin
LGGRFIVSKLKAVVPPLLLGVISIAAVIFIFSGISIFPAGFSPFPRLSWGQPARPVVVATVNGRDIPYDLWQETTRLDRVMDGLVGKPAPSAEETLDRLINEILVLQAANLEGAGVAKDDVEKRIADLEAAWKVSDGQVITALQEAGLGREALVRRTGRLILVQQGLATITAERGDADAWLAQARREARIGLYTPLAAKEVEAKASPPTPAPTPPSELETAPQPGALAPDFTLPNLRGETVSLSSLRGQPVVINFWATWCPPCRDELPTLRSAYAQHREQGLEILAVDVREGRETVAALAADLDLDFPILLDDSGAVADIYQVRGTPTSLFVGPDGVVTARHLGPLDQETLASYLAPLVEGQANR